MTGVIDKFLDGLGVDERQHLLNQLGLIFTTFGRPDLTKELNDLAG